MALKVVCGQIVDKIFNMEACDQAIDVGGGEQAGQRDGLYNDDGAVDVDILSLVI